MATSGSTDWSLTGGDIVKAALRKLRVKKKGTTVSSEEMSDGLESLNALKSSLSTQYRLWKEREFWVFLVEGQADYNLPGANAALKSEISETTLDADEASGQTVISVTSTSGFTNSDTIGIVQDDDTIHWSTISSFVTNDTVTIADATTAAASSGNKVYVYTTAAKRPLRIGRHGRRRNGTTESPTLTVLSRADYKTLPNKTNTGVPVNIYYNPLLTTGVLSCWPAPSTVDDILVLDGMFPLEDFDSQANDPDFPVEWNEFLIYKLAECIAPEYDSSLTPEAQKRLAELERLVENHDEENDASFTILAGR